MTRRQLALLVAVLLGLGIRLWLAATTFGTNDVHYWAEFARAVRADGPIDVYAREGFAAQYNHPPLTGWFLSVIGQVDPDGALFRFLLRLPSCLADVLTSVLVYDLLRRRADEWTATLVAASFALSPIAVTVSGFHGNSDPVFVALLLGGMAAIDRERHALAGACVALALSVKLVPLLLAPALLVVALRRGRGPAIHFLMAAAVTGALVWVPALVQQWDGVVSNVLAYRGIGFTEWGIPMFLRTVGAGDSASGYIELAGLPLAVVTATFAGTLAFRHDLVVAVALPMAFFLVLTPAFAMQYLVWPLALVLVLHPRLATAYHVAASLLVLVVYSHWSGALPGQWYEARATPFWLIDIPLMVWAWLCLLAIVVETTRRHGRRLGTIPRPVPHADNLDG